MFWRTLLPFDILFSGTGAQGDEAPASPQGVPLIPTFAHKGRRRRGMETQCIRLPLPGLGEGAG